MNSSSPFPPIADYAFLSNCHTGALVAPDGSIDWLCTPAFDSPSVFGSLLDRGAGYFRLAPDGLNVPTARHYNPGTNVLHTTWHTPSGWVMVQDALTIASRTGADTATPHTRPPTDFDADHMLVRTVECLTGTAEIELVCEPLFDYGRAPAKWSIAEDGHSGTANGGSQALTLTTDMALGVEGDSVRARHVLHKGEWAYAALSWSDVPAPGNSPGGQGSGSTQQSTTGDDGSRGPASRTTGCAAPLERSALTIKGLTYMPTGATVAALTTSLPETPGGERNWDYRYTWMRDSTFTLQALHFLNLDWEAEEFMQFVADIEPNSDGSLQIMYGIDGRRDLTETTRDELSGYEGAHPVRSATAPSTRRQNDVYGAVLDSLLLHTRRSQRLPGRLWPLVKAQAECATAVWDQPDQGIWEARGEPQHYVSSKLMCWVALDRAAKIAAIRDDPALEAKWSATADQIRADILSRGAHRQGRTPPALRHRLARRVDAARGVVRVPSWQRRTPEEHRRCHRQRPDRGRLRPALPHGRDRRRSLGQGGHLPDLLVLAGLGTRDRRRDVRRRRR